MLIAEEYALLAREEDSGKVKVSGPHLRIFMQRGRLGRSWRPRSHAWRQMLTIEPVTSF